MVQILLLGDSLIADHDWQKRMPLYKVHNLGVPGAVVSDLHSSLSSIKENHPHADIIMIMIGTNDLLNDNLEFATPLKQIIVQLHQDYPLAELLISGLFPMELPHLSYDTVPTLNAQIEATTMQTGSCFLDAHKRFSRSNNQIFQDDGVHITDTAYEIWARTLIEHIAFLIEDD